MIMCPACNEPAAQHDLRVDHIAHGMRSGTAICRGERCEGDVMHVVMKAQPIPPIDPTGAIPQPEIQHVA